MAGYIIVIESKSDRKWYYKGSPDGEVHMTQDLAKAMRFSDPAEAGPALAELIHFRDFVTIAEVKPDPS